MTRGLQTATVHCPIDHTNIWSLKSAHIWQATLPQSGVETAGWER